MMVDYQIQALHGQQKTEGVVTLLQNSPNPFIEMTLLWFSLPDAADAKISIFDAKGREVYSKTARYAKGENHLVLQRSDLREPGQYTYRIDTASGSDSRKLMMF